MRKLLPQTHRRHPAYAGTFSSSDASIQHEDVDQLWIIYKSNPTVQLRNRLIERYMHVVHQRAERVWSRLPEGIELDDLIQVGTCGLMDAISSFDPSRGIKFEAFCLPRIQGAMQDELRAISTIHAQPVGAQRAYTAQPIGCAIGQSDFFCIKPKVGQRLLFELTRPKG